MGLSRTALQWSQASRDQRRFRVLAASRFVLLFIVVAAAAVGQSAELDGTLMFLHVWKCGGTSLRRLLCEWAHKEDLPCATVAGCGTLSLEVRKRVTPLPVDRHFHTTSKQTRPDSRPATAPLPDSCYRVSDRAKQSATVRFMLRL